MTAGVTNSTYLTHWGLAQPLFSSRTASGTITPIADQVDPAAAVLQGCLERQGLILLSGSPAVGRTTILRWLGQRLPAETHDLLLVTPVREVNAPGWLLPRLARWTENTSDQQNSDASWSVALEQISKGIERIYLGKRHLVIAVDNTERITGRNGLDEIASLLDMQSLSANAVSFVLVGSAETEDLLAQHPTLAARIAARLGIGFRNQETFRSGVAQIINDRASPALGKNPFSSDATETLTRASQQNLHTAMAIAEASLGEAATIGRRDIDTSVVERAIQRLGVEHRKVVTRVPAPAPSVQASNARGALPEKNTEKAPREPIPFSSLVRQTHRGKVRKSGKSDS